MHFSTSPQLVRILKCPVFLEFYFVRKTWGVSNGYFKYFGWSHRFFLFVLVVIDMINIRCFSRTPQVTDSPTMSDDRLHQKAIAKPDSRQTPG